MATDFVGLTVTVKLKDPPNASLRGLVADVVGSTLYLSDVLTSTGHRLPEYTVRGTEIADLEIAPEPSTHPRLQNGTNPLSSETASVSGERTKEEIPRAILLPKTEELPSRIAPSPSRGQQFVDPAILSFGKRPLVEHARDNVQTYIQQNTERGANLSSTNTTATVLHMNQATSTRKDVSFKSDAAINSFTNALEALGLNGAGEEFRSTSTPTVGLTTAQELGLPSSLPNPQSTEALSGTGTIGRRMRRGGQIKGGDKQPLSAVTNQSVHNREVKSPKSARRQNFRGSTRPKEPGWRQTPILEEVEPGSQRIPGLIDGKTGREAISSVKRQTKRQRALDVEQARNGWATEDATDVQDMGEFDFASNLSKFDKKAVFDQFQVGDTTADEDRLVSYNRIPPSRPGTFGGKNLHPSERVLATGPLRRSGESVSGSDLEYDSGRNSRRAVSRTSLTKMPLRKNSQIMDEVANAAISSGTVSRPVRSNSRPLFGSPKPGRLSSPIPNSNLPGRPHFRIASTGRSCPTIMPGAIIPVESLAQSEFNLTEDITAENAGRAIAEVTLSAMDPGGRRLSRDNQRLEPVVSVVAGKNKSGVRAIAAARHLQQRGIRVLVCILGLANRSLSAAQSNASDLDLSAQVDRFKSLGGYVRDWTATSAHLKTLDAPPELIVDALLGVSDTFEDLNEFEQREFIEIVGWANKSKACVLAVDLPSGINGLNGQSSMFEGEPLEVHARFIVSVGAPVTGLLEALIAGEGQGWQILVADVGINAAWKTYIASGSSGKQRTGVKFGFDWIVKLDFVDGSE